MDTVEKYFHLINHRLEVESMDTVNTGMGEDRVAELNVIGREPEGVVLARHCIDDGAARHRQSRREWEELVKSGCSEDRLMFTIQDFSCSSA
jgi:hypothetical protein